MKLVLEGRARVDDATGCWEWLGSRNTDGYGSLRQKGKGWWAHRWAYVRLKGPIPDGLTLDHLCRNRGCVNPDHLEPVTLRENLHRSPFFANGGWKRLRRAQIERAQSQPPKTHCRGGHEFTAENTTVRTSSKGMVWRDCLICRRERKRAYRARGGVH